MHSRVINNANTHVWKFFVIAKRSESCTPKTGTRPIVKLVGSIDRILSFVCVMKNHKMRAQEDTHSKFTRHVCKTFNNCVQDMHKMRVQEIQQLHHKTSKTTSQHMVETRRDHILIYRCRCRPQSCCCVLKIIIEHVILTDYDEA